MKLRTAFLTDEVKYNISHNCSWFWILRNFSQLAAVLVNAAASPPALTIVIIGFYGMVMMCISLLHMGHTECLGRLWKYDDYFTFLTKYVSYHAVCSDTRPLERPGTVWRTQCTLLFTIF